MINEIYFSYVCTEARILNKRRILSKYSVGGSTRSVTSLTLLNMNIDVLSISFLGYTERCSTILMVIIILVLFHNAKCINIHSQCIIESYCTYSQFLRIKFKWRIEKRCSDHWFLIQVNEDIKIYLYFILLLFDGRIIRFLLCVKHKISKCNVSDGE